MNSKNKPSIRVFGQRTIASTFRNLPPRNPSEENVTNQASRKSETTHPSLSHFLDPKPQKSPLPLQTVPGKSTPFLSPFGLRVFRGEDGGTVKEVVEKEKNGGGGSNDKVIFESFKLKEDKGDFVGKVDVAELENSLADDDHESKKRKTPYEGENENQTARKHVVVLGGESKLKPKRQNGNDSSNKKPRPYNHYANGNGWWDHDMEGVDNEALGFNEVWEGVGSTTLGGIVDWH